MGVKARTGCLGTTGDSLIDKIQNAATCQAASQEQKAKPRELNKGWTLEAGEGKQDQPRRQVRQGNTQADPTLSPLPPRFHSIAPPLPAGEVAMVAWAREREMSTGPMGEGAC